MRSLEPEIPRPVQAKGATGPISAPELSLLRICADPRALHLIIMPTEHCNFRCTYCYEDFAIGRMSAPLVGALKKFLIARRDDVDQITLSWFGGEPTLALPIVLDVSAAARDAYQGPNKTFSAAMTTNGYRLSGDVFASLVAAGVTDYQITLDGPREVHDGRRVRANGGPSFDTLWRNLVNIAATSDEIDKHFHVGLRIHYDRITADQLKPLVDQIKTELLPCKRFSVHFHELEKLGGPNDDAFDPATEREHGIIRELAKSLRQDIDDVEFEVAHDVEGYVCYAAKANSFVVRGDGRLAKCTVAMKDPRNDVGLLNLDGTMTLYGSRLSPWLRGVTSGDRSVLACPLDGMAGYVAPELWRNK